ncbi:hypothetical protein C8J57DRAFT_1339784, partial [Mycena rebaudengoi]
MRRKIDQIFSQNSRLRCMPHTVHRAVLQLLEAIGAVEKSTKMKTARASPYQESVTVAPECEELDEDAAAVDEEDDVDDAPMPTGS